MNYQAPEVSDLGLAEELIQGDVGPALDSVGPITMSTADNLDD